MFSQYEVHFQASLEQISEDLYNSLQTQREHDPDLQKVIAKELIIMSIFTKRAQQTKMMLGEASVPFLIPVAGQ